MAIETIIHLLCDLLHVCTVSVHLSLELSNHLISYRDELRNYSLRIYKLDF